MPGYAAEGLSFAAQHRESKQWAGIVCCNDFVYVMNESDASSELGKTGWAGNPIKANGTIKMCNIPD